MINAEKYINEILKTNNRNFSFNKRESKITNCNSEFCEGCLFNQKNSKVDEPLCNALKLKWLVSEYKEPVKLTKFERDILKHCLYKNRNYIARDYNDNLYVYEYAPKKDGKSWENLINCDSLNLCEDMFLCVTWNDEKPQSIVELLKDCEVVEDDL